MSSPIWCYASVTIDGNKEKLKELYSILESIGAKPSFKEVLKKRGKKIKDIDYDLSGGIEYYEFIVTYYHPRINVKLKCDWDSFEDLVYDLFNFGFDEDEDELLTKYYYEYEVEGFQEFKTNDWEDEYYSNRYFVFESDYGQERFKYATEEEVLRHLKRHLPDLTYEDLEDEEKVNERLRLAVDNEIQIIYIKYLVGR